MCIDEREAHCAHERAAPVEMATVPSGEFAMGSTDYASEQPVKTVHVRAFRLATTEVSRGLFLKFVKETAYPGGHCFQKKADVWEESREGGWSDPGFPQTSDHPAVCVSWADAQAFLVWLNKEHHSAKPYRLPSEAEWEYAARAGAKTRFPWGDAFVKSTLPRLNCDDSLCVDGYGATSPARSFAPNAYGLFDMLGNVWEWTTDCWQANYKNTPADGEPNLDGDCNVRVLRGGSWASKSEAYLRFSNRDSEDIDSRNANIGFRIAQDLD
ncbi:MAG TPA: formylglycine-generating enzyme family protein [Pseudomonadales bacterium]|nr:formylglycine-generating enzyme family protein [Pseudomonadales bacterium]